jgi:nucleoid-associated protein YgaU
MGRPKPDGFQGELIEMRKSVLGMFGLAAISLAVVSIMTVSAFAADVSKGQFYTEEEYQKLSKDEREAYCNSLASEATQQASMLKDAQARLDAERAKLDDLRAKLKKVDGELQPLEAELSMLEQEMRELESLPTEWTVRRGETLYKISGYDEIYSDPTKWPRIYRANRDKIEDPNLIYPDWILAIPRGWPTMHIVMEGEWLARIASYWEIYGDWREWTKIYEANRDKISDPDLILPGWELDVPR